jgi:hypothetical protein
MRIICADWRIVSEFLSLTVTRSASDIDLAPLSLCAWSENLRKFEALAHASLNEVNTGLRMGAKSTRECDQFRR